MKLGLFMMPLHPPSKPRTQCFDEDLDLIVRADELDFTEAWIGQHHTVAWEPISANDIFIANALPRTKKIRLGTGVSIIPQHHPANVAVRLALLDHLSHGRLYCGFGQGGVPTDWELFDLPDPKTQGLMTLEGIDMILKLWQSEAPFDFQGKFWHIKIQNPNPELGIGTLLKPYQQPHPPIAMSIIRGTSMAARMAGQRGYIPISTNLVTMVTVKEHWQVYCEGAADAALTPPDRSIWRIARSIFVGETNEAAWEQARNGGLQRAFEYQLSVIKAANMLNLVKSNLEMPDEAVTPEYMLNNLCIIGSPEECVRQLKSLYAEMGGFGTLLMIAHDWDDKQKWLRSMDLLARQVVPALP